LTSCFSEEGLTTPPLPAPSTEILNTPLQIVVLRRAQFSFVIFARKCVKFISKARSRIELLYGAPASSIQVLQRLQNNAVRIVLQAPRRSHAQTLLRELHWLPIQHRIEYKVAVLTFKSRSSATAPTYLSRHIKARVSERTIISANSPSLNLGLRRISSVRLLSNTHD